MKIDKRKQLEEQPFSYQITKAGKVLISRNHALIMQLGGNKAEKLIYKLENADELQQQLLLAKITGHYKHGNER